MNNVSGELREKMFVPVITWRNFSLVPFVIETVSAMISYGTMRYSNSNINILSFRIQTKTPTRISAESETAVK